MPGLCWQGQFEIQAGGVWSGQSVILNIKKIQLRRGILTDTGSMSDIDDNDKVVQVK